MIDYDSLKKVSNFLQGLKKLYYFHAGFGLHLRNFSSELDDIDVKVFHDDLKEIYIAAQSFFDCEVSLSEGGKGKFGEYMFPRVEIQLATPVDICTRTGVINHIGNFEFPFLEDHFKNAEHLSYKDLSLPVASVESLLSYYLILRRGEVDGKNDEQKIKEIIESDIFKKERLFELFRAHPNINLVKELFATYSGRI